MRYAIECGMSWLGPNGEHRTPEEGPHIFDDEDHQERANKHAKLGVYHNVTIYREGSHLTYRDGFARSGYGFRRTE